MTTEVVDVETGEPLPAEYPAPAPLTLVQLFQLVQTRSAASNHTYLTRRMSDFFSR